MKFRLEKKEAIREIEESLADNKKALEVFENLLNKEKQLHRKANVKISLFTIQIVLVVVMSALYFTDIISIVGVNVIMMIEVLLTVVVMVIIYRGDKYLLNEIDFINGLLKERGIFEETPMFQSDECLYTEIYSGFTKELVRIEGKCGTDNINSCKIHYFKKISWGGWDYDKLLIEDKCQILVEYNNNQSKTFYRC